MEEQETHTRVGIGVMIFKDNKILLGKRKGKHGAGEYAFPGGHLEFMESFEDCARRETREEAGIEIKNIKFVAVGNTNVFVPRHYVHLGLIADWAAGEPQLLEPDKSEGWAWYGLDELPEPLFYGVKLTLDAYKNHKVYYDIVDCQSFED
jgi:8-oxo-dGTP diphosphatase